MSSSSAGAPHISARAVILDGIRTAGTISRVELARTTGLAGAAISTTVRRLVNEGLVVEVGRAESTGGKPRTLLQLDPTARFTIGIHLDLAGITYVLANFSGAVVARWSKPGAASDEPQEVVDRVAGEVDGMIARAGIDRARVLGLGVATSWPITTVGGAVIPPALRPWAELRLADALEDRVGLPVLLDDDATAAAVGEHWAGGAEASSTFAALYMGTWIGSGVLVDGTAYRGPSSRTGQIGHICVDLDGPECWCGSTGCLEALAGPTSAVAAARAAGIDVGPLQRPVGESFSAIARAALRGEPEALAILQRSARYVGVAAHTLATIMEIDRVVLTGPSFALAGSLYLPAVQDQLNRSSAARGGHPVGVTISSNASAAAAVGAAALVLHRDLAPRTSADRPAGDLAADQPGAQGVAASGALV